MPATPIGNREGGRLVKDDQFALAAIFVQLHHKPATVFPVAALWTRTTLLFPSMLSTTASRAACTVLAMLTEAYSTTSAPFAKAFY